MMSVAVILVLAWALSSVGKELGAAAYIAEQAQAGFPYWLLPAVAFFACRYYLVCYGIILGHVRHHDAISDPNGRCD